jgi:hypothetical protein
MPLILSVSLQLQPTIKNPKALMGALRTRLKLTLNEGFRVETVSPNHLRNHLELAKVLGVYTMDPFGLGPASTTLASIFKKEPYLAKHFQALLKNPSLRRAKRNGLKVIIGGPGAWQPTEKTLETCKLRC